MSTVEILPKDDRFNIALLDAVRPDGWENPTPDGKYNLVIIGAGSAGLTAASGAASLGAKVALIEKSFMGGDCLNYGCVPSKALIRSGRTAADVRDAAEFGVSIPEGVEINFGSIMQRVRSVRADIAPHDSARRFTDLGVDVYFGTAEFTGPDTVKVGGQTLNFAKALISTGSQPAAIPIPGLAESGYLTNESVFNLLEQPKRLAVIGGGPIGSELAQAFQRLGTQVYLIDISDQILSREDADAAELVQQRLKEDGVELILSAKTSQVEVVDGQKVIHYSQNEISGSIEVDDILLAVGRRPNVNGLNLEAANIEYTQKGIVVNDMLQTTNPNIFAAGDVASPYQFTHVAGHSGAIVVQNALVPLVKRKFSDLIIPWVTYTDPEVAHVGLYPHQAEEQGIEIDTYSAPMGKNDRAIAEGDTDGFIKVHTKKGTGTIVGATIVSRHSGDLLNEITFAMKHKISLGSLSGIIRPYPTQGEVITKVAIEYNKTRFTDRMKGIFNWVLKRARS